MGEAAVLAALAALIALPMLALRSLDSPQRRRLLLVLAVAFLVRLVVCLVLNWTHAWHLTGRGATTPDEATVDLAARLLVRGDPRSPLVIGRSLHTSWLLVSWSIYRVLWNSLTAIKLLNVALGTVLLVPMYLLGLRLHSQRAGLIAAWLVALFPNAVVWSALALREPLIALLIALLLLLAIDQSTSGTSAWLRWVGAAAACLAVLGFTRSYMTPLLMVVLLMSGVATALAQGRPAFLSRATAAVGLAVIVVLLLPTGQQLARSTVTLVVAPTGSIYNPFSDCGSGADCTRAADPGTGTGTAGHELPGSVLRHSGGNKGRSGGTGGGDSDLLASLQSVHEKGVVRAFAVAVLAGRPVWRTAEFFLLLQPGVVIWWTLLPLTILGLGVLVRRRRWDGVTVAVLYPAAVVVFLAYTGQFIRHHYMIEPIGLVAAAVGWEAVRAHPPPSRLRLTVGVATVVMALAAAVSVAASLV